MKFLVGDKVRVKMSVSNPKFRGKIGTVVSDSRLKAYDTKYVAVSIGGFGGGDYYIVAKCLELLKDKEKVKVIFS